MILECLKIILIIIILILLQIKLLKKKLKNKALIQHFKIMKNKPINK